MATFEEAENEFYTSIEDLHPKRKFSPKRQRLKQIRENSKKILAVQRRQFIASGRTYGKTPLTDKEMPFSEYYLSYKQNVTFVPSCENSWRKELLGKLSKKQRSDK